MEQLNFVKLIGVVGAVRRDRPADATSVRVGLATNYAYRDVDGAAVIETSWHDVIVLDSALIKKLEGLQKGDRLFVSGRIRYVNYTAADGVPQTHAEIIANNVSVLDGDEEMHYESNF